MVSCALRVFKNQVAIQVEQVRIDLLHQFHFAKDPGVLQAMPVEARGVIGRKDGRKEGSPYGHWSRRESQANLQQ